MPSRTPNGKWKAQVHTALGSVYLGTVWDHDEAKAMEDAYWDSVGGRYSSLREPRPHRMTPNPTESAIRSRRTRQRRRTLINTNLNQQKANSNGQ